ncbi:acyl-CoA dehydrogenase family protein [Cohnella caldifontis]|uniref:acyl-CoA dehydrogenase family protein n=1 Tax=Cohnella caldifontis TaxID=3027471 RepID=UPI0023EAF019|nr:acyl-CoA dehydrogenase family protein [Cohnella sp. YIM B05605]
MTEQDRLRRIADLVDEHLKPYVKRIDGEAFYPEAYLRALGGEGHLPGPEADEAETLRAGVTAIRETSRACLTTGFNLWCHMAALTYVRYGESPALRERLLPRLADGSLLGGTGLSNPMKFYAGLDKIYLRAEKDGGGYRVTGTLPMVSNLGDDHWFGIVADAGSNRIMAFVPCASAGLTRTEQLGFLGLNGSATYACRFDDVHLPAEYVLSEQADELVRKIRPSFILYQIPLGLGLIASSADGVRGMSGKQGGCNSYLRVQADDLESDFSALNERLCRLMEAERLDQEDLWRDLVRLRLDVVYAALRAAQCGMLHTGSSGYKMGSDASRRLREAYFLANLTPTVRHLEKMNAEFSLQV